MADFIHVVVLICILSEIPYTASIPVLQRGKNMNYSQKTIAYLRRYGYLVASDNRYEQIDIFNAVKDFQSFIGLAATGVVTPMTREIMSEPRCSEKDIGPEKPHITKMHMTYSIATWTTLLNAVEVNRTVANAIAAWSSKETLLIEWTDGKDSDILIIFEGIHNHEFKYVNEPMKISFINSTFYVYLKEDVVGSTSKLYEICLHAFGHILGYGHESPPDIMSPILSATDKHLRTPVVLPTNMSCTPVKLFRSIFSYLHDGDTYIFGNSLFWKLNANATAAEGYPKNISEQWHGVPEDFDEVMVWGLNWRTYFFKGHSYYRYDGKLNQVEPNYPMPINRGWVNVPDNIDAAFTDENRFTYFLKDHLIYYYDNTLKRVGDGFPKNITDIYPGLPSNIDTAFRNYRDGQTYFFKGNNYYKWIKSENYVEGPFSLPTKWKNICSGT